MITKTTEGYVRQRWNAATRTWGAPEFFAEDGDPTYEDDDGNPVMIPDVEAPDFECCEIGCRGSEDKALFARAAAALEDANGGLSDRDRVCLIEDLYAAAKRI